MYELIAIRDFSNESVIRYELHNWKKYCTPGEKLCNNDGVEGVLNIVH